MTSNSSAQGHADFHQGASFRDPGGALRFVGGVPIRFVRPSHQDELRSFLGSGTAQSWRGRGALVESTELAPADLEAFRHDAGFAQALAADTWGGVWRHERIFFPSAADEWSPGMLHGAGTLTLQPALDLLSDGRGLKDATPANVLFRGSQPTFVDLLSIEQRDPRDPLWLPYAQFIRMFVLPLLVNKVTQLPLRAIFSVGREGIEPEMARELVPMSRRLHGPGLWQVTVATALSRSRSAGTESAPPKRSVSPEQVRYVLKRLFKGLQKSLDAVGPSADRTSSWTGYVQDHHSPAYFEAKRAFVASAVEQMKPKTVLDIGCNTGELSAIAAGLGAQVVAIDNDPQVVERVYRRASRDGLSILPLVVDIAAPTPGRGWLNAELPSFLDRATGAFDQVLAMAVIHHLLATNGIPLPEILDLFARLTRGTVALEFVPPSDPLFRRLARGRDYLYAGLTRESFEEACRRRFDIVRAEPLPSGDRVAYVLRKLAS
jgi:SAM-dependent methyltransferase